MTASTLETGPRTFRELLAACRGAKIMTDMITGRIHVGCSYEKATNEVLSFLSADAPAWYRRVVERMARVSHRENRKLYRFVMGGSR